MNEFIIKNLHANVEGKEILKGVNLTIKPGEIHAVMGPNGSGKSTLANVIMGNPNYEATKGEVLFNGKDILKLEPDERAKEGLFLGFQYPSAISGITVSSFIRTVLNSISKRKTNGKAGVTSITSFHKKLKENMEILGINQQFAERYLNEGFSGGEKKVMEILQMLMFEPRFIMLDEIDSGLDIDALKNVSNGVNALKGKDRSFLIITHYQRILSYIVPDFVHIMKDGRITKSGGKELAHELEQKGYKEL